MQDFNLRFRGSSAGKVDAKGRTVVPSRFRDIFKRCGLCKLVVTGHPYGYLIMMAKDVYEKLERKVSGMPDSGGLSEYFKQTIIGMAEDNIELDSAGRVKVSKALLEHARIKSCVTFVGLDNKIRMWSTELLEQANQKYRPNPAKGDKLTIPEGWDAGFTV